MEGHIDIDSFYEFTENTDKDVVEDELNTAFTAAEASMQAIEDRVEDTFEALHGLGVLSGLEFGIGAGLSVTVAIGTALIGVEVTFEALNIPVEANSNPGYIYLLQDGTYEVNVTGVAPSDVASILRGTFVSDADSVTSVSTASEERVRPAGLVVISDTITDIEVDESGTTDYYVEHEDTEFAVPGLILINVDDQFTVDLLYSGLVDSASDSEYDPPHNETPTGFWVRIQRVGGYEYATYPTTDLSYSRTGFVAL